MGLSEAPAPVDGWTARDVVRHLVVGFPAYLRDGGVELGAVPSVDDDPVAAWQADDTLDADEAERMLAGMLPIDDMLRTSGQYGPKVPVPDSAPPHERLMAFVGRDPSWRP
jgi:hypothetical protein